MKIKEIRKFKNGLAAFEVNGRWGFINEDFEVEVKPKYIKVSDFDEGAHRAIVTFSSGRQDIIEFFVFELYYYFNYFHIDEFKSNKFIKNNANYDVHIARVSKENKSIFSKATIPYYYGYINEDKVISDCKYSYATEFKNKYGIVEKKGKYYFIDIDGNIKDYNLSICPNDVCGDISRIEDPNTLKLEYINVETGKYIFETYGHGEDFVYDEYNKEYNAIVTTKAGFPMVIDSNGKTKFEIDISIYKCKCSIERNDYGTFNLVRHLYHKNGKIYKIIKLLDKNGNDLIYGFFKEITILDNGLIACIDVYNNIKFYKIDLNNPTLATEVSTGYNYLDFNVDKSKNSLIASRYEYIDGEKKKISAFITQECEELVPDEYEEINHFNGEFAIVKKRDTYYESNNPFEYNIFKIINRSGNVIGIFPENNAYDEFSSLRYHENSNLFIGRYKNYDKSAIINKEGKIISNIDAGGVYIEGNSIIGCNVKTDNIGKDSVVKSLYDINGNIIIKEASKITYLGKNKYYVEGEESFFLDMNEELKDTDYYVDLSQLSNSSDKVLIKYPSKNVYKYVNKSQIKIKVDISELLSEVKGYKLINGDKVYYESDNHYVISEKYRDILKYIDLEGIYFSNVDVRGINFIGSNAVIHPQSIYKMDMSDTIVDISNLSNTNLEEINLINTKIYKDGMLLEYSELDLGSCKVKRLK